jgi:hypothetical protein
MTEQEGYLGVINLLKRAGSLLPEGEAKDCVRQALQEVVRIAKQGVTNLEMGIDLGQLLARTEGLGEEPPPPPGTS